MAKYKANWKGIVEILIAAIITWIIFDMLHIFG